MIVVNGKPISLNGKFFEYKNEEPTPSSYSGFTYGTTGELKMTIDPRKWCF